ncbi:MAG TPA: hypothetical protein VF426_09220, partial [Marmoricola sp.]
MPEAKSLRPLRLTIAAACLLVFAVLAVLAHQGWHPLATLDHDLGQGPFDFTRDHTWMRHLAIGVGHAFGSIALTIATVVV